MTTTIAIIARSGCTLEQYTMCINRNFANAIFSSDLGHANIHNSDLYRASFERSDLIGADFEEDIVIGTNLNQQMDQ
jgi:uncharacterized protein YjbI with pentapeptide repeats